MSRRAIDTLAGAMRRLKEFEEAREYEGSLAAFLKGAWPTFDPAEFMGNWHFDAIAEHLEAVANGQIKRLLINQPPRTGKTSLVSICFPAWVWAQRRQGPLLGPKTSFFYASYAEQLSLEHSLKTRRLVESRWYKRHWGDRFSLLADRNTKGHFENDKGGYRMASSVDARAAGFGADILVADDPHLVKEAESELVREGVVRWWTETMPSRLNDRRTGAMIVVMQRVHEGDLSGHVISQELGYEHLMLPLHFDEARVTMSNGQRYQTCIGFEDPRENGELLWPERLPEDEVKKLEKELGPYGAAGQLEQSPAPRGGGILKEEWWQPWSGDVVQENGAKPGEFPPFEFIIGSLDTAHTDKEENDPCALSIWGLWRDKNGNPNIMLMFCWAVQLQFHDLVKRVIADGKKFKLDRLLIEDKAVGHSVAYELHRLLSGYDFGVELVNPKTGFIKSADKVARVHSVVHLFAEGLIWAPFEFIDRTTKELVEEPPDYVNETINECSVFPRGTHDDRVDTVSMALLYLRRSGLLMRREEREVEEKEELRYRPRETPLYPA